MQVKNIHLIDFGKKKDKSWSLLKILITVACLYFLVHQFQSQNISFRGVLPDFLIPILILELFFMSLNWYLEAFRWKISIKSFEEISLPDAWIDVLSGLAMNWVFPFTTGDLLARIRAKKDRYKTTSAILLNRGIMLLFTSLLGMYGIIYFMEIAPRFDYLIILILIIVVAEVIFRKHLKKFLSYFTELEKRILWKIILISLSRYLVFVCQFLTLLYVFLPTLDVSTLLAGVGWVFFIRSTVPSLLGGIGLREASALLFFQGLIPNNSMVIIPIFLLWLINTVLPSIGGLILIWKLRVKIA